MQFKRNGQNAAVKRLKYQAGEMEKRQFLEEAILLSKLHHQNIIIPLGICMDNKPYMLALEFMNGGAGTMTGTRPSGS